MQDEETAEPALLAPVEAALDDDLNTPAAIAELHELTSRLNRANDAEKPGLAAALRRAGALLGLLQDEPDRWLQGARPAAGAPSPAEIRSDEHTSELQSLMRISYAVCCLKKNIQNNST